MPWKKFLAALLLTFTLQGAEEERIWVDATVNKQPAKIFLDTGAAEFYLFRHGAERLGLEVPDAQPSQHWRMYWSDEKCHLECIGFSGKIRPAIAEPPTFLNTGDAHGFLGWKTIRNNIIRLDALHHAVTVLPELPPDAKTWTRLKVYNGKGILALQTAMNQLLIIDTGSGSGVGIPKQSWLAWKSNHPKKPITIKHVAMPSAGIVKREHSHADTITVGPLTLTDVEVEETEPWSQNMAKGRHSATLGLAALKRMDLIIDGKKGWAYIRPR